MVIYQCICVLGVVVWSYTFHNASQCTITGVHVCIYSPTDPPYPCAIFLEPPLLSDSVFFRQSYITPPPFPSLELSAKHMQSPPAILHLSSSTYLLSYDIWWGGQGKREEAGGKERKEVAGVGRGKKNVKVLKGWKKGKFCACRSEKGGGRQGAGGVRPTPPPPVHPLIFEKPAVTTLKNV